MAALFTLLLGMSAILLGYFLYDFGQRNFLRETEAALDSEIDHILAILDNDYSVPSISRYIAQRTDEKQNPVYLYQLPSGEKQAGNLETMPENVERITEGVIGFYRTQNGQEHLFAAKIHTFPDGAQLLVARDIHKINQSFERLQLFSCVILLFMLMVILVSFFISTFVVSRINIIASTAQRIIQTGDLSQRISIKSSWDDLSNLAQILNALLERIETLMHGIRDVSDNIAHDLRTPLTRLHNHLEELKKGTPTEEDIDGVIAEADHILNTFNSLLRIANIEKSKRHQNFTKVALTELLNDVIELYEPLAEDRHIAITTTFQSVPLIQGDRDLLFQLFANILDNALKFSPEQSCVNVESETQNNRPVITITDQGPGISDEEKDRIFDRFYRAEKSRTTAGSGLGLSLVKAVADLHNARIIVDSHALGLRITLHF